MPPKQPTRAANPLPSRLRIQARWSVLLPLILAALLFSTIQPSHSKAARADSLVLCTLSVPANPLSSGGLATPWQLGGGCHEAVSSEAVFIQGVIFNPVLKTISTYSPLVIDTGTAPAILPVAAALPPGAIVALFGGGNDDATTLVGPGASSCVNGASGRVFGQVFFCHSQAFFAAVNAAQVAIPPLGLDTTGQVCPTVRDFRVVDQDQSDNVQTTYLVLPDGQTAQNTAANRAALGLSVSVKNPSDNRLLTNFIDPAIGCVPWRVPDLADGGALQPTQATDELQAAASQRLPSALIPAGDPMVGPNVLAMVNAYRLSVDQPAITALGQAETQAYCAHLKVAPAFFARHQAAFQAAPSPTAGVTLSQFLVARYLATRSILGCH